MQINFVKFIEPIETNWPVKGFARAMPHARADDVIAITDGGPRGVIVSPRQHPGAEVIVVPWSNVRFHRGPADDMEAARSKPVRSAQPNV